jgi:hypothetical protein
VTSIDHSRKRYIGNVIHLKTFSGFAFALMGSLSGSLNLCSLLSPVHGRMCHKGCGAFTGEMAVDQIKDLGMKCVLIGHSERRGEFGLPTPKESNALMATKLQYILDQGLMAVFCVGEPLPVREQGIAAVLAECVAQLQDIVPILKALKDKSRVSALRNKKTRTITNHTQKKTVNHER